MSLAGVAVVRVVVRRTTDGLSVMCVHIYMYTSYSYIFCYYEYIYICIIPFIIFSLCLCGVLPPICVLLLFVLLIISSSSLYHSSTVCGENQDSDSVIQLQKHKKFGVITQFPLTNEKHLHYSYDLPTFQQRRCNSQSNRCLSESSKG